MCSGMVKNRLNVQNRFTVQSGCENLFIHTIMYGDVNQLLGPFHGAIAVPSVTRRRCRRGHRCAISARQYR